MSRPPLLPDAYAATTVLALDASSGWCSAALLHRGALQYVAEPIGQGHSRRLLPMIDELLGQHRLRVADCHGFAFGAGPGAFTGLRIACGLAQGLGFAAGRPVVPVDCLQATALYARRERAADAADPDPLVAVALDARMSEVYYGLDCSDGGTTLARTFGVADPRQAAAQLAQAAAAAGGDALGGRALLCAGDGFERHGAALAGMAQRARAVVARAHARADAVALLAAEALSSGGRFAAADAAPRYVRDKVALDVGEQQALRAARAARTAA